MAKRKWWQWLLSLFRIGAQAVEDGDIGSGKKTATGGKIAGGAIDGIEEATKENE